jgi:hypothetical protein
MTRRVWVYYKGEMYEKGTEPQPASGVTFMPDLPDFVSPIDGKLYRGRAGMREHNAKHNVVPTADLAGLPFKTSATEYKPDRAAIREEIKKTMYQKGYLR